MALLMGVPVMGSNYSLELNSVGFYQLAKICQTPTVVVLDWVVAGKKPPTPRCCMALAALLAGVLTATINDVTVQLLGACVALGNLPMQCLQKVLMSKNVREGHEPLRFLERLMPWSALALGMVSLPLEGRALWNFGAHAFAMSIPAIFFSAVAAFFSQWSCCLVLGHTSALTFQLVGQLKSVMLLLGGHIFFAEESNPRMMLGATLAISSGMVYTYLNLEDQKKHKALEEHKKTPACNV